MARYIDAVNMYKEVCKRSTSPLNEWDTWGVLNVLDMVKTEDVAPVVHAHNESETGFLCSSCTFGDFGLFRDYRPNYCPNCGAKMDGVVDG